VLEKLDELNWKSLNHAYGSAGDVPQLIRGLLKKSPDPWADDAPLPALFSNIWHQGTAYEATAYAVPFLFELVQNRQTPQREFILMLLAAIAEGSSFLDGQMNFLDPTEVEAELLKETRHVLAAYTAVSLGINILRDLLLDPDAEVRIAAVNTLACLRNYLDEVEPVLRDFAGTELSDLHRAGVLLSLGKLGACSKKTIALLRKSLELGPTQRAAAAAALAMVKPGKAPEEALGILYSLADQEAEVEEMFRGLPWDVGADLDIQMLLNGPDS